MDAPMLKVMDSMSFNAEIFGFSAGKKLCQKTKKAVQNITDIFFADSFNVIYNTLHITMSLANYPTGRCKNMMFVKWYMLISKK